MVRARNAADLARLGGNISKAIEARLKAVRTTTNVNERIVLPTNYGRDLATILDANNLLNVSKYIAELRKQLKDLNSVASIKDYLLRLISRESTRLSDGVIGQSNIPDTYLTIASDDLVSTLPDDLIAGEVSIVISRYQELINSLKKYELSQLQSLLVKSASAASLFTTFRGLALISANTSIKDEEGNQVADLFGVSADPLMIRNPDVAAVLSILPLYHVQAIEVARSGKILKFRATGSVFLANQEGGEDAVRVEGFLYRREVIWLLMFWSLFLYGQGKTNDIPIPTTSTGLVDIRKINDIASYDPNTTKPSYEFHRTFPLVTRHIIIPNIYIETMSFEERLIDGLDVIKYSLLLRTYDKPSGFELYKGKKIYHVGIKRETTTRKMLEFGINAAWRTMNANNIFLNETIRTIDADAEVIIDGEVVKRRDDVYYDYDIGDIAYATAFSLMGLGFTGGLKI